MKKIGIVDTTFSRVDMGAMALEELKKHDSLALERRTVPGIKDLAVECKRLLESGCDIVLALGMVGGAPIDQQCAHEASLGIQQAKLWTDKHILEVFVHENEAWNPGEFKEICADRVRKHAQNAALMITRPEALMENAGLGIRQGKADEGPARDKEKVTLGIVVAQFNDEITGRMQRKALEVSQAENLKTVVLQVPGVYDMPLAVKKLLMDKQIDAVITLGAVVKGETAHDEVITKDAARRIGDLSLEYRKPVSLGIIGHGVTWEAAKVRAEEYAERAVQAALAMIQVLK